MACRSPRVLPFLPLLLLLLTGTVSTQSGPAHHWTFDEESGLQVIDSTGGVTGTLTDVQRVPGVVGSGAVHVQPWRTSIVNFGSTIGQFGTNDFTFSLWVRTNEPHFSDVVGNRAEGSTGNYVQVRLGIDGNNLDRTEVAISENSNGLNFAVAHGQSIRDSQWHLVTARRQGTALSLFLDGQLAETVQSSAVTNIGVPGREFHIGLSLADCCPGFHSAHMQVDDFRIWSRSLTDAEVASQYFVPPVQPPLGDPLPPPPPPPPPPCDPFDGSSLAPIRLVKDFNTTCQSNVTLSSGAIPLGQAGDRLIIRVGGQLWSTTGSDADLTLIKTFTSSVGSVSVPLGARVVFAADDTGQGPKLWISDGTPEGTSLLSTAGNPLQLTSVEDRVFFSASRAAEGQELWVTDGTAEGTQLVKDIAPGMSASSPANLMWALGRLWFSATSVIDGVNQRELWTSDGTESGTALVANLNGAATSSPNRVAALGNRVYFYAAGTGIGRELHTSDGTPDGTGLVRDIRSGSTSSNTSPAPSIVVAGERLYFVANDGPTGNELWTSDGTAEGTTLVVDLAPGLSSSLAVNAAPSAFGGRLYFSASNGLTGFELWSTDGTADGTVLVKDLAPGTASSSPAGFVQLGNRLFFRAAPAATGAELFVTDGTSEGTTFVADLYPGSSGSNPVSPIVFKGSLFFGATHPAVGAELWAVDVDGQPPTINVSHVADGFAGWNRTAPVLISVDVDDPEGLLSGAPACTIDGEAAAVEGDSPAYTLSISSDGRYAIECTVGDSAGNTATDSDSVSLDTVAPGLVVTHVADGPNGSNLVAPVTVQIVVTDEGNSPVGDPYCEVNGVVIPVAAGEDGYTLLIQDDGVSDVYCTVTDEAGNEGTASDEVRLDTDLDGDGIANSEDPDDDGDGAPDSTDAFPFDPAEQADTDGDGQGNTADADDDNDGTPDVNDALPLDATEQVDTDGDSIGNNADTDDDNDGIADVDDPFSTTPGFIAVTEAVAASLEAVLSSLPAADGRSAQRAIDKLNESLAACYWEDATHLTSEGGHVFTNQMQAVHELMSIDGSSPAVTAAINTLLASMRAVASVVIADATAANGDARQIRQATDARADGDSRTAAGNYDQALIDYRQAWDLASKSMD